MRIELYLAWPKDSKEGAQAARWIVKAMALCSMPQVLSGRVPPLYDSGVRYAAEKGESVTDALTTYSAGVGDCAHLAAWRLAELWAAGERGADCRIHWREYSNGRKVFHVLIRRTDGTIEDPSRLLGM